MVCNWIQLHFNNLCDVSFIGYSTKHKSVKNNQTSEYCTITLGCTQKYMYITPAQGGKKKY